jgi:hypothetical protein
MSKETVNNEDKHYKVRVTDEGVLSVDEVAEVVKTPAPVVLGHSFKPVSDTEGNDREEHTDFLKNFPVEPYWQQPETD